MQILSGTVILDSGVGSFKCIGKLKHELPRDFYQLHHKLFSLR